MFNPLFFINSYKSSYVTSCKSSLSLILLASVNKKFAKSLAVFTNCVTSPVPGNAVGSMWYSNPEVHIVYA